MADTFQVCVHQPGRRIRSTETDELKPMPAKVTGKLVATSLFRLLAASCRATCCMINVNMGYILAGTVGFISALVAYFAIQKIPYVTEVNTFILSDPEDVFEFMKNPKNQPDINYKM